MSHLDKCSVVSREMLFLSQEFFRGLGSSSRFTISTITWAGTGSDLLSFLLMQDWRSQCRCTWQKPSESAKTHWKWNALRRDSCVTKVLKASSTFVFSTFKKQTNQNQLSSLVVSGSPNDSKAQHRCFSPLTFKVCGSFRICSSKTSACVRCFRAPIIELLSLMNWKI